MKVAIIKYNAGNIQSVKFALNRLGVEPIVSGLGSEICSADKIIFPGVGQAASAMEFLKSIKLDRIITELKQPVLGICLGMQLMCEFSEEGETECLGIFKSNVKRFYSPLKEGARKARNGRPVKVPQIGWNRLNNLKSPLFKTINEGEFQYFVHGYYVEKNANTIATTNYINEYSSAIQKNNFYGVQFHPEKSAKAGEQILKNFLDL
jgi:imidazole glycerol-phosphate synthase subunit HisH